MILLPKLPQANTAGQKGLPGGGPERHRAKKERQEGRQGLRGPGGERKKRAVSLQGVTVRGLGNVPAAAITTIHKPNPYT